MVCNGSAWRLVASHNQRVLGKTRYFRILCGPTGAYGGMGSLTLNQRAQGSSPCAPTNKFSFFRCHESCPGFSVGETQRTRWVAGPAGRIFVPWGRRRRIVLLRRSLAKLDLKAGAAWLRENLDAAVRRLLREPWIPDVDTTVKPLYGHREGAVGVNSFWRRPHAVRLWPARQTFPLPSSMGRRCRTA